MWKPDPRNIPGVIRAAVFGGVACGVVGVLGAAAGGALFGVLFGGWIALDPALSTSWRLAGVIAICGLCVLCGTLGVLVGVGLGVRGRLDFSDQTRRHLRTFFFRCAGEIIRVVLVIDLAAGALGVIGGLNVASGACAYFACNNPPAAPVDGVPSGVAFAFFGAMIGVCLGTILATVIAVATFRN